MSADGTISLDFWSHKYIKERGGDLFLPLSELSSVSLHVIQSCLPWFSVSHSTIICLKKQAVFEFLVFTYHAPHHLSVSDESI